MASKFLKIDTSALAFFSLLLLLPVGHLKGYYIGAKFLPLIRGTGLLPLAFSVLIFILLLKGKHRLTLWAGVTLFLSTLSGCALVVLFSPNLVDTLGRGSFKVNLYILAFYFVYFFIGYKFQVKKPWEKWVFVFWIFMVINLFIHYDFSHFQISLTLFDADKVGMYLFFGDSFAIWTFLVLSLLLKRPVASSLVVLCTVFSLFSFISRTALYAFVLVLPVTLILIKKSARYLVVFTLLLGIFFFPFLPTLQETSRRMFAFQNLATDSSVIARAFLFDKGFSAINQNWFIGDYSGQLRYGSLGSYIHNYLSLWRQFGFLPFFSFIILLAYLLTQSIRFLSKARNDFAYTPEHAFLIMGGCFCLIEIVAARSYTSPFIWFFIGMAVKLSGQNFSRSTIDIDSANQS